MNFIFTSRDLNQRPQLPLHAGSNRSHMQPPWFETSATTSTPIYTNEIWSYTAASQCCDICALFVL